MQTLIAGLAGLLMLGSSNAWAHDESCDYEDHVTAIERGYDADLVHYDHHHYYYDEDGNLIVRHHDHHYIVPNDDYGYRRQYYYNTHRRHRPAWRFFFGG